MMVCPPDFKCKKTKEGLKFRSRLHGLVYIIIVHDGERFWSINCCDSKEWAKREARLAYKDYKKYGNPRRVEVWKKYKRLWSKKPNSAIMQEKRKTS